MRPRALSARLTAWYAVASVALVLTATAVLYRTVSSQMRHAERDFAADRIYTLRAVLDESADVEKGGELVEEVEKEWPSGPKASVYVRVLSSSGEVVAETRGMGHRDLAANVFPAPVADRRLKHSNVLRTEAATGRSFALFSVYLETDSRLDAGMIAQVAVDATPRYELLQSYRRDMAVALGLTGLLATVIGYFVARGGLEPVERIGRTLSRIRSTTLHERLDPQGLPVELSLLAVTCNDMLDGLEESFARLIRFSADIAHELRTPINNLRGEVEVALGRARSEEEYRSVLGSCLEEVQRLSKLIDSLLFLARAEGSAAHARKEPLDLAREIAAVAEFYEALASESGVRLHVDAGGNLVVPVDRALFQSAVGNLVANAIAATSGGGSVEIRALRDNGAVCVEVSDTGRGIPAADLPRVFDRLYRADASRATTGSSGGAGLGLSIVRAIMALHDGSATIRSREGAGTTATLRFPAGAGT